VKNQGGHVVQLFGAAQQTDQRLFTGDCPANEGDR
jgi:hypothetical protein